MFPFTGLRLLVPALIPSWRFFNAVRASPRLDYALLTSADDVVEKWEEFSPRVPVLDARAMLRRLIWNPQWNESLYLVSLAERLVSDTTEETERHSERELLFRTARYLDRHHACDPGAFLQIRLRFVARTGRGEEVSSQVAYVSTPRVIAGLLTR